MDPDYQVALLIQRQLEYEDNTFSNGKLDHVSDQQLAASLQEQFNQEDSIERPHQNLVYHTGSANRTKSLTDPSWEVIDPTPDIHVLFVAFNERFFWNKLLTVCVSWSKRMTTCAGVCSYHGRGGMCSITLSEPLLKLRPRKDLVETLLHEMIHAYLFVTHNNKDRDGHGPEFHKHMYRINAEAGTNITVYHDFHDEVKLYQTHWWRCTGPCRLRKPYYGFVKRATNRAPGPNDRWWTEHQSSCGGSFIKVKEPEKQKPVKVKPLQKENSSNDIRNYLPTANKLPNSKPNSGMVQPKAKSIQNQSKEGNSSNIHGFFDISEKTAAKGGKTKTVINSSTVVITKTSNSEKASNNVAVKPINKPNNAKHTKNDIGSGNANDTIDYSVVRNHWINKFDTVKQTSNSGNKRHQVENTIPCKSPKLAKVGDLKMENVASSSNMSCNNTTCPVCGKEVSLQEINAHLDACLGESDDSKQCIICNAKVKKAEYESHVIHCCDNSLSKPSTSKFHESVVEVDTSNSTSSPDSLYRDCIICFKEIEKANYKQHIELCSQQNLSGIIDFKADDNCLKLCPVCEKQVDSFTFEEHVETCLSKMYEDMEKSFSQTEEKTNCLICNKEICRSELNAHLEICTGSAFSNSSCEGNTSINDSDSNVVDCPFCMMIFSEDDLNKHLDECLNSVDDEETELNKSILLDAFCRDDLS